MQYSKSGPHNDQIYSEIERVCYLFELNQSFLHKRDCRQQEHGHARLNCGENCSVCRCAADCKAFISITEILYKQVEYSAKEISDAVLPLTKVLESMRQTTTDLGLLFRRGPAQADFQKALRWLLYADLRVCIQQHLVVGVNFPQGLCFLIETYFFGRNGKFIIFL